MVLNRLMDKKGNKHRLTSSEAIEQMSITKKEI